MIGSLLVEIREVRELVKTDQEMVEASQEEMKANQEKIEVKMEANQENMEEKDSAIYAYEDSMEIAIISTRSGFEETMKSRVEGVPVSVALNGHGDQHSVATATVSIPTVSSIAARQQQQAALVAEQKVGQGRRRNVVKGVPNKQTRMEGWMINKIFLDLKECIRAISRKGVLPLRCSDSVKEYKTIYKQRRPLKKNRRRV
jgi:hypothetical protein